MAVRSLACSLALLLASLTGNAGAQTITTVAGGSWLGDGEPATSAGLNLPVGVAVDERGNLFIADLENHRIRKLVLATGIITTVAGSGGTGLNAGGSTGDGGPATSAQLDRPTRVALDVTGNFFIVDATHRIRRVDARTGIITTVAGTGVPGFSGDGGPAASAQLNDPRDVAVDASGNLFIADSRNHRIRMVAGGTGVIMTVAGTGTPQFSGDGRPATSAQLNFPSGVALDGRGSLFIGDTMNSRMRRIVLATGIITTVAGVNWHGYTGDGGPATKAAVGFPGGIAVDERGNLFILGQGQRVRMIAAATGVITTVAGTGNCCRFSGDGGPAAQVQLNQPAGVAVDRAGNLFIADSHNYRVRKVVLATGIITTVAGSGKPGSGGDGGPATSAKLHFPTRVAIDGRGNLLIADEGNRRIREVNLLTGVISTITGGADQGLAGRVDAARSAHLRYQIGVAVAANGDGFIADPYGQRVRKVDRLGNTVVVAGTGRQGFSEDGGPAVSTELNWPFGVAVDGRGNLYIAEGGATRVRRVALATGIITTVTGTGRFGFSGDGGPATSAMLDQPSGLAIDANGNLYIADLNNHRVRRVDPSGIITTVAGTGKRGFSGDGGPAASAQLHEPRGLAVDEHGNLYIGDMRNHRIRRVGFSPPPAITGLSVAGGVQGKVVATTITGTNLAGATGAAFGPDLDVTLGASTATSLTAELRIGQTAAPGPRSFAVATPGGLAGSGALPFIVLDAP